MNGIGLNFNLKIKKIKNIIYNDIHPKNVLIKKGGNIVLLDYQETSSPRNSFFYSL